MGICILYLYKSLLDSIDSRSVILGIQHGTVPLNMWEVWFVVRVVISRRIRSLRRTVAFVVKQESCFLWSYYYSTPGHFLEFLLYGFPVLWIILMYEFVNGYPFLIICVKIQDLTAKWDPLQEREREREH